MTDDKNIEKLKNKLLQLQEENRKLSNKLRQKRKKINQRGIRLFSLFLRNNKYHSLYNKIKDTEEKFRLIFFNASDAIILNDDSGNIIEANHSASEQLGYSRDLLLHKSLIDIDLHYNTQEKFRIIWNELTQQKSIKIESELKRKDGTSFPVKYSFSVLPDKKEKIIISYIRDISIRKAAEKEVKKLSEAIVQSPVSIVITDIKGNIEYVNPKFISLTGYTLEEVKGQNPRILKGGTKTIEEYKEMYNQLLSGKTWKGEFLNKKKDGTLYWEFARITPIKNDNNEIINFLAVKEDITKRKEAEKEIRKLSTAVSQSPASIVITDKDGNIEYVNPLFTENTGYSYEEAIGKNPRILKSGHTTPEEYKQLWQQISGGNTWKGEFLNVRKNGTQYWELAVIAPIKDENGNISNYIAVKEDITKQKEFEDALKNTNEKLKEANATKDKFFSIIAHDLRSPLGNVYSIAELLNNSINEFNKESLNYWIKALYESSVSTLGLLDNLLTWSRSQRNIIPYKPEIINLYSVAYGNVDIINSAAQKKIITINLELDKNTEIFADKEMLNTIFRNLLSNAVKFTHQKGVITISATAAQNDYVTIAVSDNGIGISEEDVPNIFKIEYNRSTKGTDGEQGTGLGLVLCKEFVEKNKGKIWIESELGKGTTFYFKLPAKQLS